MSGSAVFCEDDVAEFVCSSDKGQLNWMITIPGNSTEPFSFGILFRDPHEINGPDSSVIRANRTFLAAHSLPPLRLPTELFTSSAPSCSVVDTHLSIIYQA